MIEIQELTFKYAGAKKNALDKISLEIEKGGFVGIIGESGAGKTTLCNCINGLIPHHYTGDFYGSVKVDGTDTFDINAGKLALKVGSVFQDIESQITGYFVEDEILFGLENFGIPADEIESRITSSLDTLGIGELRHKEISSLSGGQKQKVVIAAILALEPDILVLDEPTGELDPASSVQIFEMLKKLNEEKGITIVVAEQKIMLLCEFVKKLIVLEHGTCVHYGEIRSTLTHQREMEEAGINCPRVLTLTGKMVAEGLAPAGMKPEDRICLNAEEAAEFVRKVTGKKLVADDKAVETADISKPAENTENSDVVLEFAGVGFSYNETANVHDLNVKVHKGDFISIIGSNGAGKSTFSKLTNGLLKPSVGDVLVLGENTKKQKVSALAKHIGFLFQNPDRQICCATVREEIAFSLRNNGIAEDEIKNRVTKTLEEFGFDGDTEPFNMSRGQRQRLCLACLIALNPEILILDEPTTGLDYRECMEVMSRIRELNANGTTVIMVCHDMEVVLDFAKTVIVMNRGEILGQGETRQVLSNKVLLSKARLLAPQIAQVAMLLGDSFSGVFTDDEMIKIIKSL
ncbi:energy-coupling factor transport system ATP-binding protein [Treponema bryantii]|uniref:Energy-coupling factor transport system ATP-binding protein n=1 Tax=Treponema bryantii TaxID=163 RepID=A0A1H9JBP0_9SPIR|nr:energy-coupling factor transporter ATPase [Treponema bryantii]SEQ84187.1 energy-coupling factor transport system ATP-binding protein [Treponema bryantii]